MTAEFPSLSNANLTEEDLNKLQTIVAEHQQLRENLVKANGVIKTYFSAVERWQNDVKQSKETDRKNISLLMESNQKMQQELRRMQEELEEEKNNKSLARSTSDVAMATAVSHEIGTLKQELERARDATKDMVPRQQYKNVERQCSQLLAENLQFKDMEQQYIDTINCLKVNHASTEELVRMGQMDLNAEREANQKLAREVNQLREENQVLIQQAEIYKKDFEAERDARQQMAGQKDEVLSELNRLRMMLVQASNGQPSQMMMGHQPSPPPPAHQFGLVRYTCSSCYCIFSSQQQLSQHLPQCGRHN